MFKNQSVNTHQFAMIPKAEIPRSSFRRQHSHKTTFDAGYLIPILVDEVLPGDTFNVQMTALGRVATLLFPIMDNLHLDTFFFFVPNRLVWINWQRFMGEQPSPGDTTDFVIPQTSSPEDGYDLKSLQDYMGLPTIGQLDAGQVVTHNALFTRAYNLIWNEWFRDENLQDAVTVDTDDGPDDPGEYSLLRRGKRHDYFTSCLPWPQKGDAITLGLAGMATIVPTGDQIPSFDSTNNPGARGLLMQSGTINTDWSLPGALGFSDLAQWADPKLAADLSTATAVTINQLRQSFQVQKLLERDARGGTRYTEIVRSHFGVISPDARLQRPEYLGGSGTPIIIKPVAQTSESGAETPQGNLSATGTVVAHNQGFTQSFTEHGMIIGLIAVRADLTYQQGLRKMWSRSTRYDFYFPVFAMLGEQAVLTKEIYVTGDTPADNVVFGYQERWAEYRYFPSMITSQFKSYIGDSLDAWHLAQQFLGPPLLDEVFIQENPPVDRIVAVTGEASGSHFIMDTFFDSRVTRPMPMYSVPGLIDHF